MITSLLAEEAGASTSWPETVGLIAMMAFFAFIFWVIAR